jgi:hypothetical protein
MRHVFGFGGRGLYLEGVCVCNSFCYGVNNDLK